jgi:hypothetical protein
MYLSPGVAPPTYTPPPRRRHLTLTRSAASRSGATLSLSFFPLTQPPFLHLPSVFPSFFFLSRSNFSARLPFPTYTQLRRVTPTYELTRSFHVALRINSRLLLSSFFAFLFPPFLAPGVVSPLRSPVTNAYQRRRGIQTPVESSRRVTSRRVASPRVASRRVASRRVASVLRALADFSISILFSRIRRNITARC